MIPAGGADGNGAGAAAELPNASKLAKSALALAFCAAGGQEGSTEHTQTNKQTNKQTNRGGI